MMTAGHILLSLPCVCIVQPFSLNINIKTAESPFFVKRSVPSMFVQRVGWRVYCATIKVLRVFFVLKMTKAGAKPLLCPFFQLHLFSGFAQNDRFGGAVLLWLPDHDSLGGCQVHAVALLDIEGGVPFGEVSGGHIGTQVARTVNVHLKQ